jgi:hypothetical protein
MELLRLTLLICAMSMLLLFPACLFLPEREIALKQGLMQDFYLYNILLFNMISKIYARLNATLKQEILCSKIALSLLYF